MGSIYKQSLTGVHIQALKIQRRKRTKIKKFLNTTYFVACKKWVVIRVRTCAYQGVRNVCFSEILACFAFLKHPF